MAAKKSKADETAEDVQDKKAQEASRKATHDYNKAQAEARGETYGEE